ncbi:MAG: type II toxin-antitoxin system MqsA family antitoxin [Gammaproteobacteria bacterium]|nr:type II toxin-antitoxin system MqsA family antitoxin [Gammaproteobacteria bacterium]
MDELTPKEIREIRIAFGLTQVEAGERLGGGPRAFTKYESGTIKPAASLVNLLRILRENPAAIATLGEKPPPSVPGSSGETGPFEVMGAHVAALGTGAFRLLLEKLLHAEAQLHGLPRDGIHVPTNITAPDGGEDARIEWRGGPDRTDFLPSRSCRFELKSGKIGRARAGQGMLTADGGIKDMIRSAVEGDSCYIMLCGHAYTQKSIEEREGEILSVLSSAGMHVAERQVAFWDADRIAAWANHHVSVAVWVKSLAQPGTTGPFRPWSRWRERAEHGSSPWVGDRRLDEVRTFLDARVSQATSVGRVIGLAGIGKSRLTLEALGPDSANGKNALSLDHLVLYANESEAGSAAINSAVQTLADTGSRAIVVIDDCSSESHRRLAGMVATPRSHLSLLTIDNVETDPTSAEEKSTFRVRPAPSTVTETIVDRELPGIPSLDRRRLHQLSRGFPAVAVRVAQAWANNTPMPYAADDHFVDAFVTGRNDPEPRCAIRTAMLIATFGTVQHTAQDTEVPVLAEWGRQVSADDMHAALERLIDRGVVQRRGRLVVIQPRPVAMRLAARQWREWTPDRRLELLGGDLDPRLKRNAASQLAWINDTDVAREAAKLFLSPKGPLDGLDRLSPPGNLEMLSSLSTIDPQRTVDCIGRTLNDVLDLRTLPREVRRRLVHTLERIAFEPETFADAARLLLKLAVAETDAGPSNNATGQFAALFPVIQGATAADGKSRIAVLREAAKTNDPDQRAVVVEALLAGAKTQLFHRFVGAEVRGSKPALTPWLPLTEKEAADYITFFIERLAHESTALDDVGAAARTGLGRNLWSLIQIELIDVIEAAVIKVREAVGDWPEAVENLGRFLRVEGPDASPEVCARVRLLIESLQPKTLPDRIRNLVSGMSWEYPHGEDLGLEERSRRQLDAVRTVAEEALEQPAALAEHLPELCRESQRWASDFGEFLAERMDAPSEWLTRITDSLSLLPETERNFSLLVGFVKGLSAREPEVVATLKREVAASPNLAPALPAICVRLGLTEADIPLAIDALRAGILPPQSLNHWSFGDVVATVPGHSLAPLFDALSRHGADGFHVAVTLIGTLAEDDWQRVEEFRPQLLTMASLIANPTPASSRTHGIGFHGEQLFRWLLRKGRADDDACTLALTLSNAVAQGDALDGTIDRVSPLLPDLLSGFPEIAWPLIGQQLIKPTAKAWELREALSETFTVHHSEVRPPVLALPPDALFAWCGAHPDNAPACAARMLPILTPGDAAPADSSLHPLFGRLLDDFGDREDVLEAAAANIHCYSWTGSVTTYFERFLAPFAQLANHPIPRVSRWAKRMVGRLEMEIEREQARDDEREVQFEV